MGGPFASYSFDLPKPFLQLLFILNRISLAISLVLVFLRLRPPPLPPPSPPRAASSPHAPDDLSSPESTQQSTASLLKSRLPVVDFARLAGDSPSSAACVVCLGGFAASDEVRELGNCRHAFHRECIDRWIDADGITCPLCRSPLLPSPEEEEEVVEEEDGLFAKLSARIRRTSQSINFFISNFYVDNFL